MNTTQFPLDSASNPVSVLYIENDLVDEMALVKAVADQQLPYRMSVARSVAEARATLGASTFDIILSDYELGDGNAFDLMAEFAGRLVIFITGSGDEEVAVKALRLGVQDYLIKDPNRGYLKLLPLQIEATLRHARMQHALERTRELLEKTGELAKVGGWEVDLQRMKLSWTAQTFDIAQIDPPVEPALEDGINLFAPEARPVIAAAVQAAIDQGTPYDLVLPWVGARGRHCWVQTQGYAEMRNGKSVRLFGTIQDITGRKHAEEAHASLEAQLRESQKMQAIGTLAGGIAHDFNNILAAILGNTELAREDAAGNARAQESLEEIHKAASRARDLVRQILSFSRRQPTERKVIVPGAVVAEAERLLRATLPPRLALRARCAADAPAVLADATQIQQVIINLATNAMQAMHTGPGHIDIGLDWVMLDAALVSAHPQLRAMHAAHPGKTLRLVVRDDGPGMDAATLQRIFEPFFTTKPVNEGTGLGLSVVHGIVQTHEGAITVESAPGEGTTFTVYLPPAAPDGQGASDVAAAAAPASGAGAGLRILYLDDDAALTFLIKRLLGRRGYRVSTFSAQREALEVLRADPAAFDLVLTDYNMPGMSGLEVAREVRSVRADLPVAVVSGFVDEGLRDAAAAAGVREVIFKATEIGELCESLQRVAQAVGGAAQRG